MTTRKKKKKEKNKEDEEDKEEEKDKKSRPSFLPVVNRSPVKSAPNLHVALVLQDN